MKRALVFSGGGSRGAYEIGAWQALAGAGMRFQGVYGTSIGAINALLFAQGDLDAAVGVWERLNPELVTGLPAEDFVAIDRMISRKRDLVPFLLDHAKQLMLDMKPLEELVRANVDESRVRASGLALGLMTVRFPSLAPAPVRLPDIPHGRLIDFALASAACFPVFAPRRIHGERYIDGGYSDNLPIDMALRDGAQEILAVDVHPKATHPEYAGMPFLTIIAPREGLGGFLDFDPENLRRSRLLGYYDAMRTLGRMDGLRYAFLRQSDLNLQRPARRYVQAVASFDARAIARASLSSQTPTAPLIGALTAPAPGQALSWKQVYLRGLELAAACMGYEELAVYDAEALTKRILAQLGSGESALPELGEKALQALARQGDRALLEYFYLYLKNGGGFDGAMLKFAAEHPAPAAAALYLIMAEGTAAQ